MAKDLMVLLVGGASSRMGVAKATLKLANNQALINFMLNKFSQADKFPVLVSGEVGQDLHNYPIIKDVFKTRLGPVAGIISAFEYFIANDISLRGCYFVPIDMPDLDPNELLLLSNEINAANLSHFSHSYLPLYIKFNSTTIQTITNLKAVIIKQQGFAVSNLIQLFKTQECEGLSFKLKNINFYFEWEEFKNEFKVE